MPTGMQALSSQIQRKGQNPIVPIVVQSELVTSYKLQATSYKLRVQVLHNRVTAQSLNRIIASAL